MADLIPVKARSLTPAQYGALADVAPELEWLANITNPKTRRAYSKDVGEFSAFTGLRHPPGALRGVSVFARLIHA